MSGERAVGKSGLLETRNSLDTQRHIAHERLRVVREGIQGALEQVGAQALH